MFFFTFFTYMIFGRNIRLIEKNSIIGNYFPSTDLVGDQIKHFVILEIFKHHIRSSINGFRIVFSGFFYDRAGFYIFFYHGKRYKIRIVVNDILPQLINASGGDHIVTINKPNVFAQSIG